jgi:hypothetical protein
MQNARDKMSRQIFQRLQQLAVLGAAGALLIQASVVAGEGAAAGLGGARAVEAGRRSDPAAVQLSRQAALKLRMDEMRERRRGRRQQREEKLRRLTPAERRRHIDPKPLPRRKRERDLGDALERINALRRRLGGTAIEVHQ